MHFLLLASVLCQLMPKSLLLLLVMPNGQFKLTENRNVHAEGLQGGRRFPTKKNGSSKPRQGIFYVNLDFFVLQYDFTSNS